MVATVCGVLVDAGHGHLHVWRPLLYFFVNLHSISALGMGINQQNIDYLHILFFLTKQSMD